MPTVISVEAISKQYRLGEVGTGSLVHDFNRIWHKVRGKEDPYLKIGEKNDRTKKGDSDYAWALQDISFQVKQGEVLGLIGRNGAGKSTLLKILSRVTKPTSGSVKVKGRIASLLEVGTGFHPELTGRENIYINGAILGMRKNEITRKLDEIIEFSGCERYIDTPVKRYSSGMYVRLAFAVAAHLEPEILIIDEVLAVGDAEFQKKCLGKMKDVAGQGRTVLFVSHNLSAMKSLCSRAIILQNGTVIGNGNTEEMIDEYLSHNSALITSSIDLKDATRYGDFGSRVKVTQIVFNKGSSICHGDPLSIDIHFESKTATSEVSFGIGFCNREGIRIASIDTDIPGDRFTTKDSQSGVVTIKIPECHLEPDTYMIDFGSRSGYNQGLDYVASCGAIMVLPGSNTPPVIAMRDSGRGGYRFPIEWEVAFHS